MKTGSPKGYAGSNPVYGVIIKLFWQRGNASVSKTVAIREDAQVQILQTALFADISLIGKAVVC